MVFDVNAYNGIGGGNATVGRAVVRREGHSTQREWSARLSAPQPQDGRLELAGYAQEMKTWAIGGAETDRRNVDLSGVRMNGCEANGHTASADVPISVKR